MRIMQVNSFPVRQNRMAFKGEEKSATKEAEKPSMQILKDVYTRLRSTGDYQKAANDCQAVFDEAGLRLLSGSTAPDDIEALTTAGRGIVQNSFAAVCIEGNSVVPEFVLGRLENLKKLNAAMKKSTHAIAAVCRINEALPQLNIQNTLPEMLVRVKVIFHLDRVWGF